MMSTSAVGSVCAKERSRSRTHTVTSSCKGNLTALLHLPKLTNLNGAASSRNKIKIGAKRSTHLSSYPG